MKLEIKVFQRAAKKVLNQVKIKRYKWMGRQTYHNHNKMTMNSHKMRKINHHNY